MRMKTLSPRKDRMSTTEQTQLCVIGRALTTVPDRYKNALHAIVATRYADGGYTDDEAAFRMRQAGLQASATSIRNHRRGFCACR